MYKSCVLIAVVACKKYNFTIIKTTGTCTKKMTVCSHLMSVSNLFTLSVYVSVNHRKYE